MKLRTFLKALIAVPMLVFNKTQESIPIGSADNFRFRNDLWLYELPTWENIQNARYYFYTMSGEDDKDYWMAVDDESHTILVEPQGYFEQWARSR